MPQFCSECGRENPHDAKFCLECGWNIQPAKTNQIRILDERYEILDVVKSGAMGCVYRARDMRIGNIVGVKKMLSSFTNPDDQKYGEERFRQETAVPCFT